MTRPTAAGPDPAAREALVRAVREFNSWRFYDCHETLEDVWREAGGKAVPAGMAPFYQGIIKAAAGYHHLLRDNHKGAVTLLSDAIRLLRPYRPAALGLDAELLLADIERTLARLRELGPDRIREFEREGIPRIAFRPEAGAG